MIRNYKKAIVFALCLTMLVPLSSMATAFADEDEAAAETAAEDTGADEGGDAETVDPITDEQAIAMCEKYAENDNFILYGDEENERLCFYTKATKSYWWTSPINVMADDTIVDAAKNSSMKSATRKQIASSVAIKVADLRQEKRTESPAPVYSTKAKGKKFKGETDGVSIEYKYNSEGVTFKVHYKLLDDCLYVYVDTDEIKEKNISTVDGKILTKLPLCPYFAATPAADMDGNPIEGYMIVPDGSGAVIEYNNGKSSYPDYTQQVYNRDYTAVPLTAPRVTEQAYLPVVATVQGSSGIVAVVSDGDANCYAKAQVSGQNKQVYNNVYFEFETRSSDTFFMSGDSSNKLNVFEKDGIKTERFGIKYFPVGDGSQDVNYADCADVYRNYLINEKGFTAESTVAKNSLYVDFFGGVLKRTSIVGLPFNLKTEITGFDEGAEIISALREQGVDSFIVNYNDWTNAAIKGKISDKVKPSGTLGGSGDFKDLVNNTEGATVFPSMNNFTYSKSSAGYWTLTSTAIRISNAYSRQSSYSLSFGVQKKGVAPALLSPSKYTDLFDTMIGSYQDKDLSTAGFGYFSSRLVGDYTRKDTYVRDKTMNLLVDEYKKAKDGIGSIIADEANAYVLPYVSQITNVPVSSSGFNLTDYDVPFYQMVIHGYVPYSSVAINGSSNSDETFLLSLASGTQIHYDLTHASSDTLQDTDYAKLFYTNYNGWTEAAANQYKASAQTIAQVADYRISKFERSDDGRVLTTTYSKDGASDVVIKVDLDKATADVNGTTVDLGNCIEGGLN